jgi:hypothetical protein
MAPQIFKNIAHQELFEKQGFLVLPFLKEEEIAHLDQYFNEEHPDLDENGFFAGSYSPDFVYKKRASDKIVSVFSRAYEETFINYAPFGGAFLYKTPGVQSELAAHQDWTIVDCPKLLGASMRYYNRKWTFDDFTWKSISKAPCVTSANFTLFLFGK